MDERAFERARNDFTAAQHKLAQMKAAADLSQLSACWSEFLTLIQRVFAKLRKSTERGPSKGWFDSILNIRNTDPLLGYLLHARNADEHGIEPITQNHPGGIGIRPKVGNTLHIGHMEISRGRIYVDPETVKNMEVAFIPARISLTTVRDRGIDYPPPSEHLGKPISESNPIQVAELALAFWEDTLAHAAREFG
jgi:hypothetical protein